MDRVIDLAKEQKTAGLVDAALAAHYVAQDAVGEKVAQGKARLRSASKTRKSRATREKIMTAATEIMVERGNADFQMSEVSDRCHMSKGSLYYYFADKEELTEAIYNAVSEELVDSIERVVAEAPNASYSLMGLCEELGRHLRTGSPIALAMTRELTEPRRTTSPEGSTSAVATHFSRVVSIVRGQLERAKAEGIVREDLPSGIAAVYVIGGFLAASLAMTQSGQDPGDENLTQLLYDLISSGIKA